MPQESPYLLVSETASWLRVSAPMVHKLCAEGVLTKIRLPNCNRVLIERRELEGYIEAGRAAPAAR